MNKFFTVIMLSIVTLSTAVFAKDKNFHIKNNSNETINELRLFGSNGFPLSYKDSYTLAKGTALALTIPPLSGINITVGQNVYEFTFKDTTDKTTYYIKFDIVKGKGDLSPQKGNVFKFSTEKYNLKNNIKKSQIQDYYSVTD